TRAVSQTRAAASASAAALLHLLDHLEPQQCGTRRDRRAAVARRLRVPAREGRAVGPGAERVLALPPRVDEVARLALDWAEQLEGLEPGPGLHLGGAAGEALLELRAAPGRHLDGVDLDDAHEWPRLAHADEIHDEDERLVRPDHPARAALAVGEVGRDGDAPAPADAHAGDALVPAGDHLALAEPELERRAAIPGGVELLARLPRHADVVDLHHPAGDGLVALPDLDVLELELVRRRLVGGDVDLGL